MNIIHVNEKIKFLISQYYQSQFDCLPHLIIQHKKN